MVTCLCHYNNIHRLKSQSSSNVAVGRELAHEDNAQWGDMLYKRDHRKLFCSYSITVSTRSEPFSAQNRALCRTHPCDMQLIH